MSSRHFPEFGELQFLAETAELVEKNGKEEVES